MYDELVKRLRDYEESGLDPISPYEAGKAADAIEELRAAVEGYEANTNMVLDRSGNNTVVKFEPKWISVTEAMPEGGVCVLVTDGLEVGEGWLTEIINTRGHFMRWCVPMTDIDVDRRPITHWMPMPKAPEEE